MSAINVRPARGLATYAMLSTAVAAVCAPLLALAWFATAGGAEMSQAATVAAWAEPARILAGPLLTFASPDGVYNTYTAVLMLCFPAIPLIALASRSERISTATRPERWGWRIAVTGYLLFGIGGWIVGFLLVMGAADGLVDVLFISMMMPGLLLSLIGSTVLGITFLRAGHRPRLTSWLLALAFPLWIVGGLVLGHNSLGIVPLFVAWAATARHWHTPVGAALDARLPTVAR